MSASPVAYPSPTWPHVLLGGLVIAAGDIAFAISIWFKWDLMAIGRAHV